MRRPDQNAGLDEPPPQSRVEPWKAAASEEFRQQELDDSRIVDLDFPAAGSAPRYLGRRGERERGVDDERALEPSQGVLPGRLGASFVFR